MLNLLTFTSCSDDDKNISADVNIPITGYWQMAGTSIETGADINGDGAVEGIVVHDPDSDMFSPIVHYSPF